MENQIQKPRASKGLSIACMSCGIASLILCWYWGCGLIPAIIALILHGSATKDREENQFSKTGKITGIIGLILSILSFIIWVVVIIILGGALYELIQRASGFMLF